MPTERERRYYRMGYQDGFAHGSQDPRQQYGLRDVDIQMDISDRASGRRALQYAKPKRKLSAWQKYIKNKRNHIKYRDGKLNLKKMGVAFRRKKRR
jgi:hypothetical protein